jgi:nitroimidazol reductase NimA-like FMN-containing flavoprotein (pyridoxamine 5'-phosphate oxidase superfamily)
MTPTSVQDPDEHVPSVQRLIRPEPSRRSLTRSACLALLEPGGHGRVAATMRAIPVIIPVSFSLLGDDIAFSPQGETSAHAIENSVVAFEADRAGPDGHTLWEVHVTGVARLLPDGAHEPGFRLSSEVMSGSRAGGG